MLAIPIPYAHVTCDKGIYVDVYKTVDGFHPTFMTIPHTF